MLSNQTLQGLMLALLTVFAGLASYVYVSDKGEARLEREEIKETVKENQADIKKFTSELITVVTKQKAGRVEWEHREGQILNTLQNLAEVDKQIVANLTALQEDQAEMKTKQTVTDTVIKNNRNEWERRAKEIKNHKH